MADPKKNTWGTRNHRNELVLITYVVTALETNYISNIIITVDCITMYKGLYFKLTNKQLSNLRLRVDISLITAVNASENFFHWGHSISNQSRIYMTFFF